VSPSPLHSESACFYLGPLSRCSIASIRFSKSSIPLCLRIYSITSLQASRLSRSCPVVGLRRPVRREAVWKWRGLISDKNLSRKRAVFFGHSPLIYKTNCLFELFTLCVFCELSSTHQDQATPSSPVRELAYNHSLRLPQPGRLLTCLSKSCRESEELCKHC
jgi:hypothetical protein